MAAPDNTFLWVKLPNPPLIERMVLTGVVPALLFVTVSVVNLPPSHRFSLLKPVEAEMDRPPPRSSLPEKMISASVKWNLALLSPMVFCTPAAIEPVTVT